MCAPSEDPFGEDPSGDDSGEDDDPRPRVFRDDVPADIAEEVRVRVCLSFVSLPL